MYTRDQVINERKSGLKKWDVAVAKLGRASIIEEAIQIHHDPVCVGIWGPNDCWHHFDWALGNAWRRAFDYDVQSFFNIDEALTDDEIATVRTRCNITEPLDFGIPRKNGYVSRSCSRHH